MKTKSFGIAVVAVLAALVTLSSCADLRGDAPVRSVEVSGTGEVKLEPDIAMFSIQVSEMGSTTSEAQAAANGKLSQLLGILEAAGVADKDISTTALTLGPEYDWTDGKQVLVGQRASQRLSVTVRDLPSLGSLVDTLGTVSGIRLDSVSFDNEHKTEALAEARKKAVSDALAKAAVYAESCNMQVGRPLSVSENGASANTYTRLAKAMVASGADAAETTAVPTGQLTVTASVSLVLELL